MLETYLQHSRINLNGTCPQALINFKAFKLISTTAIVRRLAINWHHGKTFVKLFKTRTCPNVQSWCFVQGTVWKFGNFPATQIFREIKFDRFWSLKDSHLTNFETLNLDFLTFLHLFMVEILLNWNSELLKLSKWLIFETQNSPKLISRKKLVAEKFWNFHTVQGLWTWMITWSTLTENWWTADS